MRVSLRLGLGVVGVVVLAASLAVPAGAATVATFADPSQKPTPSMFQLDLPSAKLTGGWPDARTGLDLELPVPGPNPPIEVYPNAWFRMTDLSYTGTLSHGTTGPGTLEFFADNDATTVLLRIDFASAQSSFGLWGGDNIISMNGVVYSGLETTNWFGTHDESFAFSLANQVLQGPVGQPIGYTSTASFTASATVPEPVTLSLLVLGLPALMIRRRLA